MKVNFSKDSRDFLLKLRSFISQDSPAKAKQYTLRVVSRITDMLQYPHIGKVNTIFDDENIREIVLDGIKIIYKIYPNSVVVLMIYRYIDIDESDIDIK